MYRKCFVPFKNAIMIAVLLITCLSSNSQQQSGKKAPIKACSCWEFRDLFLEQHFHMQSPNNFRIDEPNIDGGRFYVAGGESSSALYGNIGIGNPNPGTTSEGLFPQPLAKLHVNGTSILGGTTLLSSDLNTAKKWLSLSGVTTNDWGLWVDRGVVATNYAITQPGNWADYVFDSTYKLRPLHDVEKFIRQNKHLPDVPSEQAIKKDGYTLNDMNARFLQKIEELTLYTIAQDKAIQTLQQRLDELEKNTDKKNRKHR